MFELKVWEEEEVLVLCGGVFHYKISGHFFNFENPERPLDLMESLHSAKKAKCQKSVCDKVSCKDANPINSLDPNIVFFIVLFLRMICGE